MYIRNQQFLLKMALYTDCLIWELTQLLLQGVAAGHYDGKTICFLQDTRAVTLHTDMTTDGGLKLSQQNMPIDIRMIYSAVAQWRTQQLPVHRTSQ
jgi:hypothetical protein